MQDRVAFVICTERGGLEGKATLLVRSLRRFGGRLQDTPVYSFAPRRGREITAGTRRWFRRNGVIHSDLALNTRYTERGVHNKTFVAHHAEKTLGHEILVFVDSDQLIVGDPSRLLLGPDEDAAARPVDMKGCAPGARDEGEEAYWDAAYGGAQTGIGTSDPSDPEYGYWMRVYEAFGIADPGRLETTVDRQSIFAYWNSGLVAVRREAGLFTRWHEVFLRTMEEGLIPGFGDFYMDQVALATAFRASGARVATLPDSYNYPIHLQDRFRSGAARIDRIEGLVTIHYHGLLDAQGPRFPLASLGGDPRKLAAVAEMARRSGVWPPRPDGRWLEPLRALRGTLRRAL